MGEGAVDLDRVGGLGLDGAAFEGDYGQGVAASDGARAVWGLDFHLGPGDGVSVSRCKIFSDVWEATGLQLKLALECVL